MTDVADETRPKFNFYQELVCKVTGYRGLVTTIQLTYGGQFRYALQKRVKEEGTAVPSPYVFDEVQLEKTAESPEGKPANWTFKFAYHDLVEDVFSGFRGKVVMLVEFANGCIRYGLRPPAAMGKRLEDEVAYEQELKLYAAAEEQPKLEKTGGPIEEGAF